MRGPFTATFTFSEPANGFALADTAVSNRSVSNFTGKGWLAGPYLVARVHNRAVVQERIAYGHSTNNISLFETYTDTFKTDWFLTKTGVTGLIHAGTLQIAPHVDARWAIQTI